MGSPYRREIGDDGVKSRFRVKILVNLCQEQTRRASIHKVTDFNEMLSLAS